MSSDKSYLIELNKEKENIRINLDLIYETINYLDDKKKSSFSNHLRLEKYIKLIGDKIKETDESTNDIIKILKVFYDYSVIINKYKECHHLLMENFLYQEELEQEEEENCTC
jgi:hypothetical protein